MLKYKLFFKRLYLLSIVIVIPLFLGTHLEIKNSNGSSFNQESDWKAPTSVDKLVNPIKDIPSAIQFGKSTYVSQCAICHGNSGEGDGVAGMGLTPRPADLTSNEFQGQSDGSIFWKITSGRPPMASYSEIFSAKQRWQLVTYLRTFKSK